MLYTFIYHCNLVGCKNLVYFANPASFRMLSISGVASADIIFLPSSDILYPISLIAGNNSFALLQCGAMYPLPKDLANLNVISSLNKKFKYTNDKKNIINHIAEFYQKNCKGSFLDAVIYRESLPSAREVLFYLEKLDKKFHDMYSQGRAYFFSTYAERINLYADLVMLKTMLESLGIDFLIFLCRDLNQIYLKL